MKKMRSILLAFILCALCAGAKAQTVSVADVEALPGETVAFVLDLTGGKADTYISLQFDVQFPKTGFTTTGDYIVSSAWKNVLANIGDVDSEGCATIPVSSSESISAADVEGLLSVSFTVGSDVPTGEYDVTLSDITFGYGFSDKDVAPDVTFKVKVVNAHTVILDENSTTAPTNAEGVNVRVKRTIKANEWSTICLPFAMTVTQVKAAFGNDVQLANFSSWSSEEDGDGSIVSISIGFSNVTEMEANHPYVIKVAEAINEFTIDGVDIEVEEEPTVQVGKKKAERGYFMGCYVANTVVPENNLFLNGNKFWYSTGLTKMKAFRGYFELADVLSTVNDSEARITFSFDDGETTGVADVRKKMEDGRCEVYDLQGRKVDHPSKGLYIVNGKKRVVK